MNALRRGERNHRLPSRVKLSDRLSAELELVKKSLYPLVVVVGFECGLLGNLFVSPPLGRRWFGLHEPLRSALGLSPSVRALLPISNNSNLKVLKIFSGLIKIFLGGVRFV